MNDAGSEQVPVLSGPATFEGVGNSPSVLRGRRMASEHSSNSGKRMAKKPVENVAPAYSGWRVAAWLGGIVAMFIVATFGYYLSKLDTHVKIHGHPVMVERVGDLTEKVDGLQKGQDRIEEAVEEIDDKVDEILMRNP